ncbi:MAG: hypothetical protein V9G29_12260 [Burkholderiaceae bacterium]
MFDAGSRLKQHPTDIVRRGQDACATLNQGRVIQRVHPVEGLRLQTAQPGLQSRFGKDRILGRAQGVLVALGSIECEPLRRHITAGQSLDDATNPQFRHRVEKSQRRTRRYAKEPIPDGGAGGRLACLVGAHDEVDVSDPWRAVTGCGR